MTAWMAAPATSELMQSLSRSDPVNPFYTQGYVSYRQALGSEAWIVGMNEDGLFQGCPLFLKVGWRACDLELPSVPTLSRADPFWEGVLFLCRKLHVSKLSIPAFSSSSVAIPRLGEELRRTRRWEFVLPLQDPRLLVSMRKGHSYSIKQARKSALVMRRWLDPDSAVDHARLVESSMERRRVKGQDVDVSADSIPIRRIMESGAGCLYQALLAGKIDASNLILLAENGAYNHSQGIDEAGREVGAAHFLIAEIATELREQGFRAFNLGGTAAVESGLTRFKSGFGGSTYRLDLEAATFRFSPGPLRALFRFERRLRGGTSMSDRGSLPTPST